MVKFLETVNHFVWGAPALLLIIGVGFYISIKTGFVQFCLFPKATRFFISGIFGNRNDWKGVSSHQALCTALAATVGTGNLAGVAGALALGGPGAIFWMWICGLLGMATKYAEATLSVGYRVKNRQGELVGGPMYMISLGMGTRWQWLAMLYCFFGVVAAFGVGNATQVNAVISGVKSMITTLGGRDSSILNWIMGLTLAILVALMLSGGAKRVGSIAERLVPIAAVFYVLICIGVIIMRIETLPAAVASILKGAFSTQAVTGGVIGSAFTALRVGAARGVFTNEAGMGTAAIAHGSAGVRHPVEQGMMGIIEVFLDTMVICTLTALVILCSGVEIPYGVDLGMSLTTEAFANVYGGWVSVPLSLSLCSFAIATILGWGMYGARCAQYLFGENVWKLFVAIQAITVVIGAIMKTSVIWLLSETVNGLMAIPNLIALAWLSPKLLQLTREYKRCNKKNTRIKNKKVDKFQCCDRI